MKNTLRKSAVIVVVLAMIVAAGIYAWLHRAGSAVPAGLTFGNGRIEATEIDIAAKLPGRLSEVLAREGDTVKIGQVLARMDTKVLEAQLREAQAMVRQAQESKQYADAMVTESASKTELAVKEFNRSNRLVVKGSVSQQRFDQDETTLQRANAEQAAAKAKVAEARAAIEAAIARVERLKTEINDSILTAPRNGRVLLRLSEPGEILPAGGKVLTVMDTDDIYMTLFLLGKDAGSIAVGADARVVLDGLPERPLPATVTYVSDKAQFTPREVETREERQKLVFRVKASLKQKDDPRLKPGMTGVAYIRLDSSVPWPGPLK
jgi:HlyD family secretion protein